MTQTTPAPHNNPTLRPPEFDLVARNDPVSTLDNSSGLCVCLNLATHQLVNHGTRCQQTWWRSWRSTHRRY